MIAQTARGELCQAGSTWKPDHGISVIDQRICYERFECMRPDDVAETCPGVQTLKPLGGCALYWDAAWIETRKWSGRMCLSVELLHKSRRGLLCSFVFFLLPKQRSQAAAHS
jgi:hypothetical protein